MDNDYENLNQYLGLQNQARREIVRIFFKFSSVIFLSISLVCLGAYQKIEINE